MTMASTGAAGHCVPAPLRRSPPPVGARRAMRRPASRARVRRWAVACASDGAAPQLLEAAEHTVDNYIKSGMMIGLGSGHASSMVMQYLGRRLREGALKDIIGIPTSISSASEAAKAGIPLSDYQDSLQIDFAFDDADIIEEGTLSAIIGRRKLEGGESITEEKSIIKTSGKLAFIITENQYTRDLDGSIPVIVKSGNWMETAEEIDDLFLGDAEVWRRPATGYAGPLGGDFPLITREGYHVLDVIFTSPIRDLAQVSDDLDQIDGVVDHGIVFRTPCTAIIASNVGLQIVDNLPMNAAGQM
uniref:ribose-5-phosphate isomerase n=1 Tax=Anthurium amnicola TaxID=1678845 RepID=A0A1D1Z587_9ARAE